MDSKFLRSFRSARQCSAPLLAVKTPDPAATINSVIAQECKNGESVTPAISWDCVRGFLALTEVSRTSLLNICGQRPPESFINPVEALAILFKLPDKSIAFFHNLHRVLDPKVVQAIWNLRDIFPPKGCTLVMLCPDINLPAEIAQDILTLEEPLPDSEEIRNIITSVYSDAQKQVTNIPQMTENIITSAVKAVSGLAAFPTAQAVAMSISRSGLDVTSLWERKRQQIEQTPGLSVWQGKESFDGVKDCDNVIEFLKNYLDNISVIVFMDEIADAFAGVSGDTSGVSQKMHGALLSYMEDHDVKGMLFLGHPGTGKSHVAKAAGGYGNKPVIQFDLSKMESRFVGDSTNNLHNALKVVSAVGQNKALFIGTCNSADNLTPQMRRRFKLGTFYFDLPSKIGREQLWQYYTSSCQIITSSPGFDDTGWTGAEIKTCCELSRDMKISLAQASAYIVPVSRSSAEKIESLNRSANGRFISAAYPGPYTIDRKEPVKATRKFNTLEN